MSSTAQKSLIEKVTGIDVQHMVAIGAIVGVSYYFLNGMWDSLVKIPFESQIVAFLAVIASFAGIAAVAGAYFSAKTPFGSVTASPTPQNVSQTPTTQTVTPNNQQQQQQGA